MSQASNWSEEQEREVSLDEINDALRVLASATGCQPPLLESRVTKNWEDLSKTSRYRYRTTLRNLMDMMHTLIAPGQEKKLSSPEPMLSEDLSPEDSLLSTVVDLFKKADDWKERRKLLSLLCNDFSKSELQDLIPELTKHQVDSARKHAAEHGKGVQVESERITRNRLQEAKVDHFVDFLADPVYLKVASYGNIDVKLTAGDVVQMPNVKRSLQACHMVETYLKFCAETDFDPLSRSTLFRLLKVCQASYSKCMQGLDNTSAAGVEAFNTLHRVVDRLGEAGQTVEWTREKKQMLDSYLLYVKGDFKMHVEVHSRIPDHCIQYSLSDPNDHDFAVSITVPKSCLRKTFIFEKQGNNI